mmetsp:Transcript_61467/g.91348  ORF Transcript_61467/g.91348 Transcript_61467/m.91348 type:complete len:97 (-) Transcript_61467:132-422(-)
MRTIKKEYHVEKEKVRVFQVVTDQIRQLTKAKHENDGRPNRGAIARRVLLTFRGTGIQTVAIHSPADGPNSLHAHVADECFMIGSSGSSSAAEKYL